MYFQGDFPNGVTFIVQDKRFSKHTDALTLTAAGTGGGGGGIYREAFVGLATNTNLFFFLFIKRANFNDYK